MTPKKAAPKKAAPKRGWKVYESVRMVNGQRQVTRNRGILHSNYNGKFLSRVVRMVNGERREFSKQTDSITQARQALATLLVEHPKGKEIVIDNDATTKNITFATLAKEFTDAYLFPPVYESNPNKAKVEKIEGLAGYKDGLRAMKMFVEYFGNRNIDTIEAEEIKTWKAKRYATKKANGEQRELRSVNAELGFLSQALGYAVRKNWLKRNPFTGAKIINSKFETKREIALTHAEVTTLLDVMLDYPFLGMLFIFLLDTGLRIGEAQKLERGMIKLNQGKRGHIYLPARITKGKQRRDLPVLTPRLREVIEQRFAMIPNDPKALVFGESYRDAFDAVREKAKLERDHEPLDIELRDTRHTWISNAVKLGIPLPQAMLYSGHKVVDTFLRYLQPDQQAHDANVERYTAHLAASQAQPMASNQIN